MQAVTGILEIATGPQTHGMTVIGGQKLGGGPSPGGNHLRASCYNRPTAASPAEASDPVSQPASQWSSPLLVQGAILIPIPRPWGVQNTPNAVWE